MPELLIPVRTKLTPPHLHQPILRRTRLLDRLQAEVPRRKGILVCAGPGYGKTVLLASLARQDTAVRYLWYDLDPSDRDRRVFLAYLVAAFAELLPTFAAKAERVLRGTSDDRRAQETVLAMLVNDVGTQDATHVALVLDDLHRVDQSAPVMGIVDALLRYLPPNLHLILATRREPPLETLARLRVAGEVIEFDERDLSFTPTEVADLFHQTYDLPVTDDDLALLQARTEGWIASLQLAQQSIERLGVAHASHICRAQREAIAEFDGTTRHLYDYLAEEVLDGHPAELKNFARRSAILRRMSAPLCDRVLEITTSAQTLDALERNNLLTFSMDERGRWYRYHPLFRGFLRRQLRHLGGEAAERQLHRRAAQEWTQLGELDEAIEHHLRAEDWPAAATLIEDRAGEMLRVGRVEALGGWLAALPSDLIADSPWLLLRAGEVAEMRETWTEALARYEAARALFAARGDDEGLGLALQDSASVYRARGDLEPAIELYRASLAHKARAVDRLRALSELAEAQQQAGDLEDADQALTEALLLSRQVGDDATRAHLFRVLGNQYLHRGELRRALETFQAALRIQEKHGNPYALAETLGDVARLHNSRGEFDAAQEALDRLMDIADRYRLRGSAAEALLIAGDVARDQENYQQADEHYGQALVAYRELHHEYGIAAALMSRCTLYRRWGRFPEAQRFGEEARGLCAELDSPYNLALVHSTLGALYVETGDPSAGSGQALDAAQKLLTEALETFQGARDKDEQTRLHLTLAVLHHRRGDATASVRHLGLALAIASQYRHDAIFRAERAWAQPLLVTAIRQRIYPAYAARLLTSLGPAALDDLAGLLADADPAVRVQAAEALGQVGDERAVPVLAKARRDEVPAVRRAVQEALAHIAAAPKPLLRIITLGTFAAYRGDHLIGDDEWKRAKVKGLFKFLITNRHRRVPRDEILEALWSDLPLESAINNFNVTLSALRRVLEPYLYAGATSHYLHTQEGLYWFNRHSDYWLDAEAFVELAQADDERAWQEAVNLYAGDYLAEDPYEDWAVVERERLREAYLTALARLAARHVDRGEVEAGIRHYQTILARDPYREKVHRRLMDAYDRAGRRAEAVQQYQECRRILRKDLDVEPARETEALYRRIVAE